MRGIAFVGDRKVELLTYPDPSPGPGEVVLQMKASGICGTDLMYYRRPKDEVPEPPLIGGHEPCGVIAEAGVGVDVRRHPIGQRVMVHHYHGCDTCEHCQSGWSQLCENGRVTYGGTAHGGHADYLVVPARTLVPLPDALSFATGAAISCGTGTAYAALRRLNLSAHDTIAIIGQGPVGLSATQLAKVFGARVIALDINAERLARAAEFGADIVMDPTDIDAVAEIKALTGGKGVDVALETSAAEAGGTIAVRATKIWGTVCLITGHGPLAVNVLPDLVFRQITVFGHWTFSIAGQMDCARFIAEHDVDVDRIFTHRWKLETGQAVEAYELTDRQTAGKGVFLM